jgi:tRNA (guanosine-2'-O-)-methyltransferase
MSGPVSPHPVDALIERHGPEVVENAIRPLLTDDRVSRIDAVLDARLTSVGVGIENLYDPHNGAAAIRSIEAFGLSTLHVIESTDRFRFSPGVTIGCEKWIGLERYPDVASLAATLRARGVALYGTLPDAAEDLESIPIDRPLVVLFGNEHEGLTDTAVAACDGAVSIRMHGFTRSFNLSVSVALVTARLAERRRAFLGAQGDLTVQERARLRARWYALSVRGAGEIVARFVSS